VSNGLFSADFFTPGGGVISGKQKQVYFAGHFAIARSIWMRARRASVNKRLCAAV
jgi:hypothetical protein